MAKAKKTTGERTSAVRKRDEGVRDAGAAAAAEPAEAFPFNIPPPGAVGAAGEAFGGTTGRYLVTIRRDALADGLKRLDDLAGKQATARASDFKTEARVALNAGETGRVVFDEFAVVVVDFDPNQHQGVAAAAAAGDSPIYHVEPERFKYALGMGPQVVPAGSQDYLRGYRDAIDHLLGTAGAGGAPRLSPAPNFGIAAQSSLSRGLATPGLRAVAGAFSLAPAAAGPVYIDDNFGTYGLHLTNVIAPDGTATNFIGSGIQIAILDTGLDFNHPDFISKGVAGYMSFIGGQSAQDGYGHGTHCAGTARGPAVPATLGAYHARRYGVAPDADLFIGKVLMNNGKGVFSAPDQNIINGIYWAMKQGCHVISMSLGEEVNIGDNFQPAYEQACSVAVQSGSLIVAASGNDSARPGRINPVSSPANCPSIIAVGGVDGDVQMYSESNGFIQVGNWSSGQVDVAAPAVNVFSSIPTDQWPSWPYGSMDGTSMATPHVAGILALWAGATGLRGSALWAKVQTACVPVSWLSGADVGRGIIQAPR